MTEYCGTQFAVYSSHMGRSDRARVGWKGWYQMLRLERWVYNRELEVGLDTTSILSLAPSASLHPSSIHPV